MIVAPNFPNELSVHNLTLRLEKQCRTNACIHDPCNRNISRIITTCTAFFPRCIQTLLDTLSTDSNCSPEHSNSNGFLLERISFSWSLIPPENIEDFAPLKQCVARYEALILLFGGFYTLPKLRSFIPFLSAPI